MYLSSRFAELKQLLEKVDEKRISQVFPGSNKKLECLEAIQGHKYRSKKVALVSLIHRSALVYWPGKENQQRGSSQKFEIQSNERLEFLGDALLSTFVATEAMIAQSELDEGDLSRLRAALVGTENLSNKALGLGIGRCLLLGKGESSSGGHKRQTILADAFEATTAALFIDAGEEYAWKWLLKVFSSDFVLAPETLIEFDAKTRFQQWTQAIIGVPPTYKVIGTESTPESTLFIIAGFIGEHEIARSTGKNKREASKRVAHLMQGKVASGELTETMIRQMYESGKSDKIRLPGVDG